MAKKKEAKDKEKSQISGTPGISKKFHEEQKPKYEKKEGNKEEGMQLPPEIQKLPPEVREKLEKIKKKIDEFQKKVTEKFDKYIIGIALLPPPPQEHKEGEEKRSTEEVKGKEEKSKEEKEGKAKDKEEKIHVLILVDDSDSQKMSKFELKEKLSTIIAGISKEVDENIQPETIILTELWQSCYDGKYDLLKLIAMGAPVYDMGMLQAIKIAEIHKTMILKKFEKYIISYVLAGSLVQGRATKTSDIDVWVVIDDTDVKKMTRTELKDKLRAIIIGMGIEAGEITGIKNKLNIQVYILTEFWDSLREANPIIFTLLRDGVPFYDRGIFMPWKQLLRMGKIKPSIEAIDLFKSTGEQILERIDMKLKDIGMEDTYYAILTPSQAALMLYGIPPPTPRETPDVVRDIFVKKEKLLEDEYVKMLEHNIQIRKDLEHGTKKNLTGKEVDTLLDNANKYLKRLNKLFSQIEEIKEKEAAGQIYDSVVTVVRDILKLEGIEKAKDEQILKLFEDELVSTGKVPQKFLSMLDEVMKAKKDYDAGKLTKAEVDMIKKHHSELMRFAVEYLQRKRGRELERAKIRIKYGEKFGEVILLDKMAFIIRDLDQEEKTPSKAPIKEDGSLGTIESSSLEEMEGHLAKLPIQHKTFIKEPIFEDLKRMFGRDVEIMVNYY